MHSMKDTRRHIHEACNKTNYCINSTKQKSRGPLRTRAPPVSQKPEKNRAPIALLRAQS